MTKRRGPRPIDPEAKAFALDAVAAGRSLRDVADELGRLGVEVSHMMVKRWVAASASAKAEAAAEAAAARPARVVPKLAELLRARQAAPPEEQPEDDAPWDYEASVQKMIRQAEAEAKSFSEASNARGAQTALRRASELIKLLGQAEKNKPRDPDVLQFSRSEIEAEWSRLEGVLSTLCSRPLLCSDCGRKLAVKFGRGEV